MTATTTAPAPAAGARFVPRRSAAVRRQVPWAPFAYVSRRLHQAIAGLVADADLDDRATVLDYGCDDSPYRGLFAPAATYLAADIEGNDRADVLLRADGTLPVEDGSVDLVLSTQVLEHVADPALYLAECARALRPGGSLVLTTHGIMFLHRDPEDYWRWTSDGLARVVGQAGLEVRRSVGVLGLVPAGLQLVQTGLGLALPRILLKPMVAVFQALIAVSDACCSPESRRDFGLVIGVRAVKPPAGP